MTSDGPVWLAVFASASAAIVASVAILKGCLVAWRTTYGERRETQKRLARLAVGVGGDYVVQTLGVPTFGRIAPGPGLTSPKAVWVLRYCILASAFEADGVAAMCIITTDRRFRPSLGLFSNEQFAGRLGKTSVNAAARHRPMDGYVSMGASTFDYAEAHYFGRPGAYLQFTLSANDVGAPTPSPPSAAFERGIPYSEVPADVVDAYRSSVVPNTLTMASGGNALEWHRALMGYVNQVVLSSSYGLSRTGRRARGLRAREWWGR